ncbi:hypothetical protein JCGZ_07897 [Jatropha curcas]|uniref:Uncharacterized protein n=1 Tax=Jatropha curcas TaxID=180498 RepID=A0A067KXW9_JATCU|nr:hypothetical protein JCGZ_07897 [Jatropha curcas]
MQNPLQLRSFYLSARIDPSREITSGVWHRHPGQRLVRVSPIPERAPVSSVVSSSLSGSVSGLDLVVVEMADSGVNETGFSPAQLKTISAIIATAFAQEGAQNQVPPSSSNQPSSPVVVEWEAPKPTLANQASVGNVGPVENDLIKQLAELKDKVEKMSVLKQKDPFTNFHVAEYVLKPTSSTSSKTQFHH